MAHFDDLSFSKRFNGGVIAKIEFDNGYGLEIIRHLFSQGGRQGLYEAYIYRVGEEIKGEDVVGYLNKEEVTAYMEDTEGLPK